MVGLFLTFFMIVFSSISIFGGPLQYAKFRIICMCLLNTIMEYTRRNSVGNGSDLSIGN